MKEIGKWFGNFRKRKDKEISHNPARGVAVSRDVQDIIDSGFVDRLPIVLHQMQLPETGNFFQQTIQRNYSDIFQALEQKYTLTFNLATHRSREEEEILRVYFITTQLMQSQSVNPEPAIVYMTEKVQEAKESLRPFFADALNFEEIRAKAYAFVERNISSSDTYYALDSPEIPELYWLGQLVTRETVLGELTEWRGDTAQ